MSCLDNFIGLRGVCDAIPSTSGLYVNDLPGISLKMISSLSDEEQASYGGVWNEVYARSVTTLTSSIFVAMQKYFRTNILLDNQVVGRYTTPHEAEAFSEHWKGTYVLADKSKNAEIYINDVQLWLTTPADTEIRIYNVNNGMLLDTISFNGVAGFNTIFINKQYTINGQRKQLFVCWDGSVADTIKSTTCGVCDCDDNNCTGICGVKGAKVPLASSLVYDNLVFDGVTHGMVINFNIVCSIENFICTMRNLFATALWYKLGENLMIERFSSERLNKYTMVNKDNAEKLRDQYREDYDNEINAVLDNLEPEGDSVCFPCEKERTFKYNLP